MDYEIPEINKDFVCVADRRQTELAAVISSYLSKPGEYFAIFEFPDATIEKTEGDEGKIDEHIITRNRSAEFNTFVANSIARMGGCNNVILAGLSSQQKSYLKSLSKYNLIEISCVEEVDFFLSVFIPNKSLEVQCKSDETLYGLYQAIQTSSILKIADEADDIINSDEDRTGLVIIENIYAVSTVIAVNYAVAINADIKVVERLAEKEEKEISYLIQEWQGGLNVRYHELSDKVQKRVAGTYFPNYNFVTFFTEGLPYSLIIRDIIPCTYVHLLYRPDFFILNNLLFEKKSNINSAVVFSPKFFKTEETKFVIDSLQQQNLYIKELIGESATAYNIDMHVKEFPFDLFHICSHGGEINGYTVVERFDDRDGNQHTIEYDEVISFAPNADEKLIPVIRKTIWRKFDGLTWGGVDFKEKHYAEYVFTDMTLALDKYWKDKTHKQQRIPKPIVPDSCAIKCSDFTYQALIQVVAGFHTSPIIFNNSCWSWNGIADGFLIGGVRGYIGTIWKVDNNVATQASEMFYKSLFDGTVLDALQKGIQLCKGTKNENIYMYWGLHFSSIKKANSLTQSRENVCTALLRSFYRWVDYAKEVKNKEFKENAERLYHWSMRLLYRDFLSDYLLLKSKKQNNSNPNKQ